MTAQLPANRRDAQASLDQHRAMLDVLYGHLKHANNRYVVAERMYLLAMEGATISPRNDVAWRIFCESQAEHHISKAAYDACLSNVHREEAEVRKWARIVGTPAPIRQQST